jgi:tetratricopeptide (TPR) repeat protein
MNGRWGEAISLYRLTVLRGHLEKARWEEALRLLQRMEGSRDFPGGTGPREIRRQASLALEQDAATLCSAAFPADALPLSDLAVRFDPSRPDSWALRAFCRQRLGMEGGAESDYRKALSLDSRNFGAVLGLSRLLQDLGRGREATTLWTDFLSLEPRNAEGWLRRGESLLSERNEAGAARDLEDACALGSTEGCRRLDEVRRGLREAPRGAAPPGG